MRSRKLGLTERSQVSPERRASALSFDQFYQPFIALSDADTLFSLVASRVACCFIAPFLGPLLVPSQGDFPVLRQTEPPHSLRLWSDAHRPRSNRNGLRTKPSRAPFSRDGHPGITREIPSPRRTAQLVSDQAIAQALDELATEYESLADRLEEEAKRPGAAQQ